MTDTVVSIGFGPGLDTKTDPKVSAKPVLLQDGIFTNAHRISKRNGYDIFTQNVFSGSLFINPVMSKSYRDELLCAATSATNNQQRLYTYSSGFNAWQDKGKYISVSVSKQFIATQDVNDAGEYSNTSGGTINSSCAILNNVALYSYAIITPNHGIEITIVDQTNGSQIISGMYIPNSGTSSRSIVLGNSALAITYIQASTSHLIMRIISVSEAGGVVVGPEITISTATITYYDAINTSGGMVVAYSTTSTLALKTYDTTGTLVNGPVSPGSVGSPYATSLALDAASNIWVYWTDATVPASETLSYAIYSSSLAVVLVTTVIATGLDVVSYMAAYSNSSTQQTLYYTTNSDVGLATTIVVTSSVTASITGTVGTPAIYIYNAQVYSKITSFNNTHYMGVMFVSDLFPTGFILDLFDGIPIAKFLPDQAEGLLGNGIVVSRTLINPMTILSSTDLFMCAGEVVTLFTAANTLVTGPVTYSIGAVLGTCGIVFDFSNINAYQGIIQQDTLLLNGGLVYQYDGSQVTELGFSVDPELFLTPSSSGGVLGSGKWVYYATTEYTDANGNLHQSAPSVGFLSVFFSGTTNSNTIYCETLSLTQKFNLNVATNTPATQESLVVINFWRTQVNGTIAYKIASFPNDPSIGYVSFIDDSLSDSDIQFNPTLYTEGGSILENIAPPPSMILWTNNDRAWCIDSENPETTIEYSKTASQGSGIAFSTGQLELVIDSKNGEITGASPMDEKTVILKANGAGYFIGDGANDSGSGSTISNFQFIPSDTGCTNSNSVVLYPGGVLFRSPKGIYQVSRGNQVTYFGMDVEAYNAQDIRSAFIVPNRTQIRFLTSSGSSLLYDYVFNQWSVFTNHAGISADQYNGLYVYVRSVNNPQDNNSIFMEDESDYLDNATPFAPLVVLQWIKGQSIQNFQRAKVIEMLGDYTNGNLVGHGIKISVAYDFGTTFSSPVGYLFKPSNTQSAFQYREHFQRQKCDSFQLQIQEIITGSAGEYIDFTDLGLEIAVKRGLNKLPGNRSVG